jgi:hypothetical protein
LAFSHLQLKSELHHGPAVLPWLHSPHASHGRWCWAPSCHSSVRAAGCSILCQRQGSGDPVWSESDFSLPLWSPKGLVHTSVFELVQSPFGDLGKKTSPKVDKQPCHLERICVAVYVKLR